MVGTEEVYFATSFLNADGGIEVTASHNPINYNGMKLVRANSRPLSSDTGLLEIKELAEMNITVNAIGPTPVETDLIKLVPKEKIDSLVKQQSIQRLGTHEDILNAVDFFIKPQSDFITGQILYLGGVN